ncbi:urocanate reductase [Anaerocolumna cellulosilytica]|uniref:Urocanate reductase n=1 Tax=Anaerocolumna cellulosilytica TaxID=433286 RepID=A0A6S6R4I2_9FIRM|nr:flavocytochrome c [Anaerocolumna cellulosilytica]MBB5197202.1 fumarate reductase flavoprotein subunit [Anaerocolumna cellulosilytica]BCJ94011.1 urocanate reductase [Anaerocolumna cellulosilytica]
MKKNLFGRTGKRFMALGLTAMLTVSLFAGCTKKTVPSNSQSGAEPTTGVVTTEEGKYTAGTYTATVTGMHEMTVTVTVSETEILDIKVDHQETPGVGEPAVESIPAEILDIQGLGVDTVSGATLTSNGILEGVKECLKQAGLSDEEIENLAKIKKAVEEEEDQELTADVVVIGAGGAGMAAAVTASQAGKKVIVIEKTGKMGGNTILSGGALNAVDEGSETALANKDSVENHFNQTFEGGDKEGDSVLVHSLVENAWSGVEWLKSLGMEFNDGVFTVTGGMWPRAHKPVEPEGTGFFKTYQEYLNTHSEITMVYNTTAKEFVVENGVVTGVVCTGKTGNTITVKASNGVVLATGGFGQNIEMRIKYNDITKKWPTLDESIPSTNTSGITGDGIIMAEAIGANLVQMGNIQLLPLGDPKTGSLSGNIEHAVESRIFVNLEGNRFVNEGGRRDEMTLALFEQPETKMYIVMDSDTYKEGNELNNFGESIADLVAAGRALKADTLEELAALMGVPAKNLLETVENYNRYCKGGDAEGQTDEFGRILFTDTDGVNNGINNGPFYAALRVPTVHHTMGGVQINEQAQVMDTNGNVIPGLFAAGEVTGGIHGSNRLGGNALTDTVVFGRIAGTSASEFTK